MTYLSVVLADGPGAEATRAAWAAGLRVPSEVVVRASRNAGIRQACGEFVAATKAGAMPSAEVLALANARGLDAGAISRGRLEERAGVGRLWTREGCSRVSAEGVRLREDEDIYPGDGSVVLGKGWFPVEGDGCYRWIEASAEFEVVRPEGALPELVLEAESGPSAGGAVAVEIVGEAGVVRLAAAVEGRCRMRVPVEALRERLTLRAAGGGLALESDLRLLNLRVWEVRWRSPWEGGGGESSLSLRYRMGCVADAGSVAGLPASQFLHVKAAEEFVMMSRAWWMALRGWPEIRIATEFVETLFCYSAHYAGLREVVLAEPLRCGARDVGKAAGAIDEARVRGWVTQMRRLGAPMIFNRGDWGM